MSDTNKLTSADIQFLLKPKRSRNSSTGTNTQGVKNNQRAMENALVGMREFDIILNMKKNLKVKISQIRSSLKPGSATFIGEKITRLEERLAEAKFVEENHSEIVSVLDSEIAKCNDEIATLYSKVTAKNSSDEGNPLVPKNNSATEESENEN